MCLSGGVGGGIVVELEGVFVELEGVFVECDSVRGASLGHLTHQQLCM